MKKLMKKLAAIALAGAMALSCCAMSFATEVDTLGGGESAGTGENESNKLGHPMRVVLPTESPTAFNMKLDPHELIKSTNAARYSGATFDYSTKLFFNTTGTNWSGNSPTLVVENKGDVDVSLGVDVTVEKNGADFTFMNSAEDLDDTADAAQMYLALVSGQTVKPIELATPKVLGTDKTNASADTPLIAGVAFAYDANYTDADAKTAFEAAAAGKSITLAIDDTPELSIASALEIEDYTLTLSPTASAIGTAIVDDTTPLEITIADGDGDDVGVLTINFEDFSQYTDATTATATFKMVADPSYTPAVTGKANFTNSASATPVVASAVFAFDTNADDTAKEALATAADGKSFELTVDSTAELSISSALDITGYTVTSNPTNVASIQDDTETLVLTINDGTSDVATVTVGFEDFSGYTAEATATVTLKVGTSGGDGAVDFKTSIPKTEGAYADQWVAAADEYQRKPVETVTEFEKVAFYLSGDINASDAWDDNGTGVKITVTWQLAEYDPEAYAEVGGSEGPGVSGGGNDAANAKPTITMTGVPTSTSGAGRATTLTYTDGTGTYAGYAPSEQLLYKRANATEDTSFTALTIDTSAKTISFTAAAAVQGGSEHRIVFTKDGADNIEVSFTGFPEA